MIGRNVARGSSLCGICLEASENSVLCLGKGLCTSHQGPSVSHFLRRSGTAQECDGLGRRSPRHLLLRHPPATGRRVVLCVELLVPWALFCFSSQLPLTRLARLGRRHSPALLRRGWRLALGEEMDLCYLQEKSRSRAGNDVMPQLLVRYPGTAESDTGRQEQQHVGL